MAYIEVDLLASDGSLQSIASVDQAFWNAYGQAATNYATQNNLEVDAYTYPPKFGTSERAIPDWGSWVNWVGTVAGYESAKRPVIAPPAPAASSGPSVAVVSTLVGLGVLALYGAYRLAQRGRRR